MPELETIPPPPVQIPLGISIAFPDFPADREETPEERRTRVVSAAMLRELVSDPLRRVGVPVCIINAVVEEEIDLSFATFDGEVTFAGTRFEKRVDLEGAHFKRHADFSRCHFAAGVTMRAAKADFDLLLIGARVSEGGFIGVSVGRRFDATLAEFGVRGGAKDREAGAFVHASLRQAIFKHATFHGGANFRGARVELALDLRGVRFGGKTDFVGAVVGGEFACSPSQQGEEVRPTRFTGEAAFYRTSFHGIARFDKAVFEDQALFMACTFGDHALFEKASIAGKAAWMGSSVAGDLNLERAAFGAGAWFDSLRVTGDLVLRESIFLAGASFRHASIGGEAVAVGSRFGGDLDFSYARFAGPAYFHRGEGPVWVLGSARFDWSVFERYLNMGGARLYGETSFLRAEIRDSLSFAGATRFGGTVSLWGASVAGMLSFVGAEFTGTANFTELTVGRGAVWGGADQRPQRFPGNAVFVGARVGAELDLAGVEFGGRADFAGVQVAGRTTFEGCRFDGELSLAGAGFTDLVFRRALSRDRGEQPGQFHGDVRLVGTRYTRIQVAYAELLQHVPDEGDEPFLYLEKVLRAMGNGADADEVYRLMRRRNGRRLKERSRLRWLADAAYGALTGYGLRSDLLAYFSVGVLALGTFVFQLPGAVVPGDPPAGVAAAPATVSVWEAAGVSLNQFLPLDIPSGDGWVPSDAGIVIGSRPTIAFRTYATFHTLCGYLLVPLFLAVVSGLLQRKREP